MPKGAGRAGLLRLVDLGQRAVSAGWPIAKTGP